MGPVFPTAAAERLLALALAEDLGVEPTRFADFGDGVAAPRADADLLARDVTSAATIPASARFVGVITAREDATVCGLPAVEATFALLDDAAHAGSDRVAVTRLVPEGATVTPGTAVARLEGPAATVLAGERTALNALMTLSGIATEACRWQTAAGPSLAVVDTRKTPLGLRALAKYAVATGGGANHRAGLFDMVLIKDNHLAAAGGIAAAVAAARASAPGLLIEVEADTVEQAAEAAAAGADLVLLDNMDDAMLLRAAEAVRTAASAAGHRAPLTEASGNMTLERLARVAAAGIDRVSASRITLTAPIDFGLDELETGDR